MEPDPRYAFFSWQTGLVIVAAAEGMFIFGLAAGIAIGWLL